MDFSFPTSITMPAIHSKTIAKVIKMTENSKLSREFFLMPLDSKLSYTELTKHAIYYSFQ